MEREKGRGNRNVRDVQEPIFVLVLFVDAAHESSCGRKNLVHENENGLLRGELYALANNVDKLSHCKVGWHKVLLLVDGGDVRLFDLFTNDLYIESPLATEQAVRA
jgi:hypothetical protein